MERYKGKKILVVGIGQTGFKLIHFFNQLECAIKVTDIKPIFDLNKAVKKLKRINPAPEMIFGEHRDEDFLEADVIVYSTAVSPELPQLELARSQGKEVFSEFALANNLCRKPIIAVCGSFGRTTVAHMIAFTLKMDGKQVFVGGTSGTPFIELCLQPNYDEIDYAVVEVSAIQMKRLKDFHPKMVIFTGISEEYSSDHFTSVGDFIETKLSIIKTLSPSDHLIVNFDKLANNTFFRNATAQTYWYTRKSFVKMGVVNEVQGTHFHDKRIHSNISCHSEFIVGKMRIVGQENRENLLASITACKTLDCSDKAIQACIEKFPGIPHRLEFLIEKNRVAFYNDSKSEKMEEMIKSISSFKKPVILIAGGKDIEDFDYEPYKEDIFKNIRVLVLVGECKERFSRALGDHPQIYLVGSFEESVLFAYQKSRTGDTIVLSPGNSATDSFRDYEERGSYFKKLIYQL